MEIKRWQQRRRPDQASIADLRAEISVRGTPWRLLIELKSSGEPRYVRGAVQQLRSILGGSTRAYGIVAAPYISEDSAKICRSEGVGYLDLAGNCELACADVFIQRGGNPKPKEESRPLRSLFAPKASRVSRVLLEEPKRAWTLMALADKAAVSLGLAFKTKRRLLDLELVRNSDEGLILTRPEELLVRWAKSYSSARNEVLECYASDALSKMEGALGEYCKDSGITCALALFSGAARVAPFSRYLRGAAYVERDTVGIAKALGWRPVTSGGNFLLLCPSDNSVFYGAREIGGAQIVSDVQLYLDLSGSATRGEEAAKFLLEQKLRPRW